MMLEELFHGRISPMDDVVPKSKKYTDSMKEVVKIMNYFESTMDKADFALLEQLQDRLADAQFVECEEQFKYGFRVGMLMLKEVMDYHR